MVKTIIKLTKKRVSLLPKKGADGGQSVFQQAAKAYEIQINELITALKDKDFGACRKWVTQNIDEAAQVFRSLYDNLYNILTPPSVPQLVLVLAKYQYQAAFVNDLEINLTACLTEIMIDCEFR